MTNYAKVAMLLTVAAWLSSCVTTFKPIDPEPDEIQRNLKVGDTVIVHTKDQRTLELKVSNMTSEAIIGEAENGTATTGVEEQEIRFDEIDALEKRKLSVSKEKATKAGKVAGKVVGGIVIFAVFLYGMAAAMILSVAAL